MPVERAGMSIRAALARVASSGSAKGSLWNASVGIPTRLPGNGIRHEREVEIDPDVAGSSLFGNNVYPRVTFMGLADEPAFRILYLS